jgi:hypothetical protein
MLLALDTRWRRFTDETRACPCCGRRFNGIFDLGFDAPDDWPHGPAPMGEHLVIGEDFLTPELCRIGDRLFLRATLSLPVRGAEDHVTFGTWVETGPDTFRAYVEAGEAPGDTPAPSLPDSQGLLANALPGFEQDSLETAARITMATAEERPRLQVEDGPLSEAQTKGISFDELLDIYAAAGDDIRPHLAKD